MISLFPSTGVPVGAATVNPTACAVRLYWSKDDMSGVSVAVDAELEVRGSMRLLVKVAVPLIVAKPPVAFALLPRAVTTPVPVVVVAGAAPAPPPKTIALAANAAEVAQVDALEKYGTPPLVPATVRAKVPLDVTGEPPTEINPPVNDWATEVTVPNAPVLDANSLTVPALFLKYSFSSRVFSASSPATKLPASGAVAAVVLKYSDMGVKPDAAIFSSSESATSNACG